MKDNVVNLITDETVDEILKSIDEIPADAKVAYEVWAIGYNGNSEITGTELLLGTFENPDDAVQYATIITWADIIAEAEGAEEFVKTSDMVSIEVETVIDNEEEGTMNVGTIFAKTLTIVVEDIQLTIKDYTVLEDGNLKVSRKLLKDFNKNDEVKILFTGEKSGILTFKIISKVIYEDGDYYHLEFV